MYFDLLCNADYIRLNLPLNGGLTSSECTLLDIILSNIPTRLLISASTRSSTSSGNLLNEKNPNLNPPII